MLNYLDLYNKLNIHYDENKEHTALEYVCCNTPKIILDYYTRQNICMNCGTCIKEKLDNIEYTDITENSQRLNIDNDLLPKSSMVTYIRGFNKDFSFLRQVHLYHRPTEERGLIKVFKKIDKLFQKYNLPKMIKKDTKYYYKELCYEHDDYSLTRGDIRSGLIIGCIYIALKNNNNPMGIKDLSRICEIDKSIITKGYKRILKIEKSKNINIIKTKENIHYYIYTNCKKLNMTQEQMDIIHLLYERIKKINLVKNNNIKTIAAGLIYSYIVYYNDTNIDKKTVLKSINISEVTLNKIYKLYMKYQDILFVGL